MGHGSHVRQDTIQRPRHTGEIQRADEQGRSADLATAACAQEAPELFLGGPSPPLGLFLEGAERDQVALLFEDPFDGVITEAADQLVLEVRDAHVETEILHAVAGEIDAEARQFEAATEVTFFGGVAQTRELDVAPTRAENVEGAPDVRRATDRHNGDALGTEVSAATRGERLQRAPIAEPFDEHDRASILVVGELHTRKVPSGAGTNGRVPSMASPGSPFPHGSRVPQVGIAFAARVNSSPHRGREARMLADIDITVGDVIIYILAGLAIGVIARAILPGKQSMSVVMTIIIGVVAAVVGGLLWEAIFPDNDGIAWIGSIIVAVVLVYLYATFTTRSMSSRTP
jgi:uncharacterized membrane protein YeaQ/YmgE (transglycosylase-associated protein family)